MDKNLDFFSGFSEKIKASEDTIDAYELLADELHAAKVNISLKLTLNQLLNDRFDLDNPYVE
jgi:hypothetical protein